MDLQGGSDDGGDEGDVIAEPLVGGDQQQRGGSVSDRMSDRVAQAAPDARPERAS
ncbi:hypothetical protein [Nesterenkonia pannonica]|uniref:hypothetical protein n=1 Tax=Nesterenkonia pannonica TaxID=1548602 RepID=UPI002164A48B|nr:hypothetical protein [Nesterenkonia pannonica]